MPGDNYNFGSIFIPKLGISESLRQGVDADTLRSAAGHPVFTAMPGESGNFVVIASRNAHWKKLESIHDGDLVTVRSKAGESLTYRIAATALLPLSDISVLSPGGGALIKTAGSETGPPKILTVTTTDAFSISSHSRSRFVAEGLLVEAPVSPPPVSEARPDEPPAVHPLSRRRRSTAVRQSQAPSNTSTEPIAAPKRHRFWHKVLHPFGN